MEPEPQLVSYQIAVSAAVLQDKEDFFSLEKNVAGSAQPSSVVTKREQPISNGKRISTLSFDPTKIRKGFVQKEEPDDDTFQIHNQQASDLYDENERQFMCATVKNEHTYSEDNTIFSDNDCIDAPVGKKVYECSICYKSFFTKFNLISHLKIHTGETPFSCTLCEKRFTHGRNLHRHIQKAHKGDDVNAASLCAKLLRASNSAENRLVIYTGEGMKPYKCAICSKTFRRLYRVKEHTRSHSGQKPFQCSVCGKTFSSSDILYRHIKRIHNGGIPLQSSVHPKSAELEGVDLENHTTVIHVEEEGPVTIPVQSGDINQVTFLHNPRQSELINVSGMGGTAYNASTYLIDLRPDCNDNLEVQEEPTGQAFQCSLCGKTYGSTALLNKHIVIHKIQVPAKCSICEKTFKAESYLKRHMSIHSDEKPFKCSLCPKSFYRPYRLSNHWRTHTGEKPYQCSICGKSFAVSDNMYRHIKKMHKGEGLQYASGVVKQIQAMNREKKYSNH